MVTELHIFRFAENAHCGWLGSFAQFTQPVVQPAVFGCSTGCVHTAEQPLVQPAV